MKAKEAEISPNQALAGMLAGDLFTIPQLCKAVAGRWCVWEADFFGHFPGDTDAFLLSGLPCRVLDYGGYKHVLVSEKEFDDFMESICSEEPA